MCHSCALLRHMCAKRMLAPEHSCMLTMGLAPEHNRLDSRARAAEGQKFQKYNTLAKSKNVGLAVQTVKLISQNVA